MPELEVIPWRHTHLVAVQVYLSSARPHFLKAEGAEAGTFVRVGSTNRRADRELVAELRRSARGEAFDEQAMPDLSSEVLDFRAASESFAGVRRLTRADLRTLRLVTTHQGRQVPTVGGVVLFGRDRLDHLPDAWIQAGRFAGLDKSRIIDSNELTSFPTRAVEEAAAFVQKHALHALEITGIRRTESWSLPPVAVREAIVNAVVHADYAQRGAPIRVSVFDDRLEVENPGLLVPGLTVDDLLQGISKLRNRVIARVFHELGLIEQWGSGIVRMRSVCQQAGLPAPQLEEIGTRFRVTLWRERTAEPRVDPIDQAILSALAGDVGLSTQEVAHVIRRTVRTARSRLLRLVEQGAVREVGSSPQDPQRKYYLAK